VQAGFSFPTLLSTNTPLPHGLVCEFSYFLKNKIGARQDVEPGFVEHGSESKPDIQKTRKLTVYTSIEGVFSFGYFSLDKQRKVTRPSWGEINTNKEQKPSKTI